MPFKVFIDDSGSKEYITPYSRALTDLRAPPYLGNEELWRANYFVLCGVRVEESHIPEINDEINALKKGTFGTQDVEIKSTWLRHPQDRRKNYLEPFSVTEGEVKAFGESVLNLIVQRKRQLKLIAIVFDKRYYNSPKREASEGSPLLKTTQLLLERVEYSGGPNVVIFDQMEANLKVTEGQHGKMLNVFQNKEPMGNLYVQQFKQITDFTFLSSSTENFLQIADICAYNVYRQFVEYGREWCGSVKGAQGRSRMSTYERFNAIRCNLMPHPKSGLVRGTGLTCIPDPGKIPWNLLDGCEL